MCSYLKKNINRFTQHHQFFLKIMRKIKKFAFGQNTILLSAEEMRQIGGGKVSCSTGECDVYVTEGDNKFHYSGTCKINMELDYCFCYTKQGNFTPTSGTNGCQA